MKVELLAPAGSYEALEAAFEAGADAVYLGGQKFGARAYADNLDQEQLIRAIDLAHLKGKQLYLTINTLLKNRELETELYEYLAPLYEAGLDAVIVQDPGVMDFVKTYFPGRAATEKTPLLLVTFPTAIVLSGKESNCTVACAIGLLSSPSTTVPLTVTRLLPWAQERVVPVHTSSNKSINFFIFLFS